MKSTRSVSSKELNKPQRNDLAKVDTVVTQMLEDGQALLHRPLLLQRMKEFGLSNNNWVGTASFQDWSNISKVGCLQYPTELVDFLLLAARHKPRNMLEIGVFTGGTAVFSSAFFQALDPGFEYLCVDIEDKMLILPETLERLNLTFRFGQTSDDLHGTVFDIVFIDGDHSFMWAKKDYLNLGRHARQICAFHDINGKEYLQNGGGVYRFWRHLRTSLSREVAVIEISHADAHVGKQKDGCWMGIGIVDFTTRG
jgi:predicted O-methyltransferase YrrM